MVARSWILLVVNIASIALASATSGCKTHQKIGEKGVTYQRHIVVLPSGSIVKSTYWAFEASGHLIDEINASDLPIDAKVTIDVKIVEARPKVVSGITSPGAAATMDTTIVALFAGGRVPGGALASTRAAVAVAGKPLVTGLNMIAPRNEHAMSNLPGDRVLITGGYGPGTPTPVLASAEIFSFATRTFTGTGSLRRARADHASAALSDGRVLVTGGLALDGTGPATIDIASTELFNPVDGSFSDGPAMTTPRFNHSAVTLNDGRVLVLGGNGRRSAEIYTPAANAFTAVGDMTAVHGQGHVAILLPSGKVLVIGGDTGNINPTAVVELFDPATNTFTVAGSMTIARMQHFAVLLDDRNVFIGGGRGPGGDPLSSSEIYNPASNTFTPGQNLPGATYDAAAAFVKQKGE